RGTPCGADPGGRPPRALRRAWLGPALRSGVAAEESDVAACAVQAHQRLADAGCLNMALAVNKKTVSADALTGRARLYPAQVDAADGELAENIHQRAGVIVGKEGDDRGAVSPCRRGRRAGQAHLNEPGDRARPVVNS